MYVVGLITAGMTAFYMWRLMALTFYGEPRWAEGVHPHESPKIMTMPLVALAAGSVLAGWIGVPKLWSIFPESFRTFETWLAGVLGHERAIQAIEHEPATGLEWALMALSVAVAVAGILISRYVYQQRKPLRDPMLPLGPLARLMDRVYEFLFVNGLAKGGGSALARFDLAVVDGGVNGTGWLTRITSQISIWWDTWIIDGAVRLSSFSVKLASYPVRIVQTGSVQAYALMFVLGVAAILGYYMVR